MSTWAWFFWTHLCFWLLIKYMNKEHTRAYGRFFLWSLYAFDCQYCTWIKSIHEHMGDFSLVPLCFTAIFRLYVTSTYEHIRASTCQRAQTSTCTLGAYEQMHTGRVRADAHRARTSRNEHGGRCSILDPFTMADCMMSTLWVRLSTQHLTTTLLVTFDFEVHI